MESLSQHHPTVPASSVVSEIGMAIAIVGVPGASTSRKFDLGKIAINCDIDNFTSSSGWNPTPLRYSKLVTPWNDIWCHNRYFFELVKGPTDVGSVTRGTFLLATSQQSIAARLGNICWFRSYRLGSSTWRRNATSCAPHIWIGGGLLHSYSFNPSISVHLRSSYLLLFTTSTIDILCHINLTNIMVSKYPSHPHHTFTSVNPIIIFLFVVGDLPSDVWSLRHSIQCINSC